MKVQRVKGGRKMIEVYRTNENTGVIEKEDKIVKGSWINLYNPSKEEIMKIIKETGVDKGFLEDSLDSEERSHIDIEDDQVLVSINVPAYDKSGKKIETKKYTTVPLGMVIVRDDYIITVSSEKLDILSGITNKKPITGEFATYKKSRIIFQVLYKVAESYITYLDRINRDIENFEEKLGRTMKNQELVQLIYFQKSMIYFDAALKSNHTVMERLKRGKIIKLYDEDEDILEDATIENRQALEMVSTYSEVLNGMIEVFSTIVSNNLNIVMKFLTSITILLAVPTLISGLMGMNLEFPFSTNVIGFWWVMIACIATTILTWVLLKKRDMM